MELATAFPKEHAIVRHYYISSLPSKKYAYQNLNIYPFENNIIPTWYNVPIFLSST
jgi:hypothetical protein